MQRVDIEQSERKGRSHSRETSGWRRTSTSEGTKARVTVESMHCETADSDVQQRLNYYGYYELHHSPARMPGFRRGETDIASNDLEKTSASSWLPLSPS